MRFFRVGSLLLCAGLAVAGAGKFGAEGRGGEVKILGKRAAKPNHAGLTSFIGHRSSWMPATPVVFATFRDRGRFMQVERIGSIILPVHLTSPEPSRFLASDLAPECGPLGGCGMSNLHGFYSTPAALSKLRYTRTQIKRCV